MADASIFQIEEGQFALTLVDKSVVGTQTLARARAAGTWRRSSAAGYAGPRDRRGDLDLPGDRGRADPRAEHHHLGRAGHVLLAGPDRPDPGRDRATHGRVVLPGPARRGGHVPALCSSGDARSVFLRSGAGRDPTRPEAVGRVRVRAGAVGGEAGTAPTAISRRRRPASRGYVRRRERLRRSRPAVSAAAGSVATGAAGGWLRGGTGPAGSSEPARRRPPRRRRRPGSRRGQVAGEFVASGTPVPASSGRDEGGLQASRREPGRPGPQDRPGRRAVRPDLAPRRGSRLCRGGVPAGRLRHRRRRDAVWLALHRSGRR